MQLKLSGGYSFDPNATKLSTRLQTLWNAGGQPYAQRWSLNVFGYLSGSGQDALIQAESALRTALSVSFQDIIFYGDDGTPTATKLINAGSISGVQIHSLEFTTTEGPEYCTIRSFSFVAEAEYPFVGTSALLLSFHETLTFWGGGPIYKHRLAINGPPQKQLVYPLSVYHVTQSGEQVGYQGYRPVPPAKFPGALMEAPRVSNASPDRRSLGQYQGFRSTWEYHFESAVPLVATPTLWVG